MNPQAALAQETSADQSVLYMFMDVSRARWSVALTDGSNLSFCSVQARDWDKLFERIDKAAGKFGYEQEYRIISGYEAGDGFWLHRELTEMGVLNLVVDPGSIERPKNHAKRPKTDRLDARVGVRKLFQFCRGDDLVFAPVHVPDPTDEDDRRLHRERQRRVSERTGHINRIKMLLGNQGITEVPAPGSEDFSAWLDEIQTADGRPLGSYLKAELRREARRLAQADAMVAEIEQAQQAYLDDRADQKKAKMVEALMWFKGIGLQTAWLLVMEMYGWRNFKNRRQIGAYAGLCGTPHRTANRGHDKGISKRGNAHVRWMAIQTAWRWVQWQPDSELTRWFEERFAREGSRQRRRGIVAVARKLLNRFRVYLHDGEVPRGATLKTTH